MRPRILIAGLFHETHTFVEGETCLADFATLRGNEMLDCRGDASPLGGVLETADRLDWEVIPAVDMRASPGGMVPDEVVETWWREFVSVAEPALRTGVDAIYLVLHGAMVSPAYEDVEGELLGRIKELSDAASLPVFGVFDLHANYTPRMAAGANCLVAYRENPHTDGRAMAVLAAELLQRCLRAEKPPLQYWRHARVVWPPTGTGTAAPPMRDLETMARALEARHKAFYAVNVVAGFSFADTAETGVSFCISSDGEPAEAQAALADLCNLAWELREAGNVRDATLDEVMAQVIDASQTPFRGPVVIAEPADNIGGGAPGDGTGLLRAFVKHDLQDAAICINDPEAVSRLQGSSPGAKATLPIGGRGSSLDDGPLHLEVELVALQPGLFRLEDRRSHLASMCGDAFDMGQCAVVRHRGVTILLTSHKTPPFDLGQWSSQGIAPEKLRVIGVKAAVAHRRAYDGIASLMLWADTPGPCRSDVTKMPYRRLRPGVYPFVES
jgi:microcystin degradation protein MlrC